MNTPKIADDLLAESSLWGVYKLSWKLNFPWGSASAAIGVAFLSFWYLSSTEPSTHALVENFRKIIETGLTFTTTILGFLIAGFTVFATITNPKLFARLARMTDEESGLSWLKKTFVLFIHTFAHYAFFVLAALLVTTVGSAFFYIFTKHIGGLLEAIPCLAPIASTNIKNLLLAFSISLFSGWLVYLALLLQGFIFNIYHTCMFSISVTGEDLLD